METDEILIILDDLLHIAKTSSPDLAVIKNATDLHRELFEERNFEIIKVVKQEDPNLVMSERYIKALYKTKNPYGEEKDNGKDTTNTKTEI